MTDADNGAAAAAAAPLTYTLQLAPSTFYIDDLRFGGVEGCPQLNLPFLLLLATAVAVAAPLLIPVPPASASTIVYIGDARFGCSEDGDVAFRGGERASFEESPRANTGSPAPAIRIEVDPGAKVICL